MHLSIIFIAVGLAILIRLCWFRSGASWVDRWQQTLGVFLFPPLLLIMTSLSVLGMGHHGTMLWQPVGWLGCHLALGFLAFAGICLVYCFLQGWRSSQQMRSYPLISILGKTGRVLKTPALFAAQVGIWKPELLISQGLLQLLKTEQIEAVLKHEEAHAYYRDNLWFFWLNWLRQITFWLPKTEALWQELLLLREIRADHWAAQYIDALVLAESLLLVVRSSSSIPAHFGVALSDTISSSRLEERIEALLSAQEFSEQELSHEVRWFSPIWSLLLLLPMLIIPFHIV